jgi:F-type H+-transporting ATPase subunit b
MVLQLGEFITQIITFLIFFWIMKKYAWPALTAVLDERQRKIEEGFVEIERKQARADELTAQLDARLRNIEDESRKRLNEAMAEGRRIAEEIEARAREESQQLVERAQRNIRIEVDKARIELRQELVGIAIGAAERLLRESLDGEAQQRQVAKFIDDLETRN